MDTVECLLQCCSKTTIVYTTRLEHMKILRESTNGQSFEQIVKAIIAESKPSPADNKTFSVKLKKSKITAFDKLTLRGSRIYKQNKSYRKHVIKDVSDDGNSYNHLVRDSENEGKFGLEEIKPLNQKHSLGMCKQLRVVLVDILKNIPKKIDEEYKTTPVCHEIMSISSDDDIDNKKLKNIPKNIDEENKTTPVCHEIMSISSDDDIDNKNEIASTENTIAHITTQEVANQVTERLQLQDELIQSEASKKYVLKSVDDFKEILEQNNFKNSLILIYNKFMGDIDAFEIDDMPSVAKCLRVKHMASIKSSIFNVQKIYNIVACCWNIRYAFVALLGNYANYSKVARSMFRQHPCREFYCRCCCKIPENIYYRVKKKGIIKSAIKETNYNYMHMDTTEKEGINKDKFKESNVDIIGKNVTKKLLSVDVSNSEPIKIATDETQINFLTVALRLPIIFKRESKRRKYLPETLFSPRVSSSIKLESNKFIKISHADGSDDIYELGYHTVIIGKITNDGSRLNSCWLSKTYKNLDLLNLHRRTQQEETSMVHTYISCLSNVESSTKIFTAYLNERDHQLYLKGSKPSRKNKKDNEKYITNQPNVHDETRIREDNSASNHENSEKCLQHEAVTEDNNMSNTVRLLINAFMQRFQNVRLTINDQGKVAAAFNAPISYLKTSELKILSNILKYAQEQVNDMGLKPGTSFNTEKLLPHTLPNEIPSATDEVKMLDKNEGDATVKSGATKGNNQFEISFDKNDVIESHTKISADNEIKNQVLKKFSGIISEKKTGYINSFRHYLGGTIKIMPKISNVFSVNKDNYLPNEKSESQDSTAVILNKEFPQPSRRRRTKNETDLEFISGTTKRRKRKNASENLDNPQTSQKKPRSDSLTEPDTLSEDCILIDKIVSSSSESEPVKSPEVLIVSSEDYQLSSSEVSDPLTDPLILQRTENIEETFDATTIEGGSRLRALLASKPKQMVFPTIVID